uniref:Uncharacterized protein n=1 Tax=Trichuris muris TaxID=70415 RepID=A0A5S6Q8T0_TRIMR
MVVDRTVLLKWSARSNCRRRLLLAGQVWAADPCTLRCLIEGESRICVQEVDAFTGEWRTLEQAGTFTTFQRHRPQSAARRSNAGNIFIAYTSELDFVSLRSRRSKAATREPMLQWGTQLRSAPARGGGKPKGAFGGRLAGRASMGARQILVPSRGTIVRQLSFARCAAAKRMYKRTGRARTHSSLDIRSVGCEHLGEGGGP